jgi:hypothetical protein
MNTREESKVSIRVYFLGIFVCSQSGYRAQGDVDKVASYPWEGLVISGGYKPNIKYKSLIILLYFG